MLGDAANTLFQCGYIASCSLLGIAVDVLQGNGLSDLLARELSNKLKVMPQEQQQIVDVIRSELKKYKAFIDDAMKKQQAFINSAMKEQKASLEEIKASLEEQTVILNIMREMMEKDRTTKKFMSQVDPYFADSFLRGIGNVRVKALFDNSTGLDRRKWKQFTWIKGELEEIDRAKAWLEDILLGEENNHNLGIFNVSGFDLPTVKGNGTEMSGRSDLAIGDKKVLKNTIEGTGAKFTFAKGLIELKTDQDLLKIGENLLEIYSLSTASSFQKGVSLLSTDLNTKWEVCLFTSATTTQRVLYVHGKKACEDFMHLIRTTSERQLNIS